jgi:monofunctional biosynthetic peptidoglycan transglycosylase
MNGRGSATRLLVALVLALSAAAVVWFILIPWPRGLEGRDPGRTALMEHRVRTARAAGDSLWIRQEWVPLDRISPTLLRAVIVAEDHRFYEHRGVDWQALAEETQWEGGETFSWMSTDDWKALAKAMRYGWDNRDAIRGRSTITQQLAKNLYFGPDRSLVRKAVEMIVARRLERRLTKDRVLELYLNVAEWGPGIFGAEAAAQVYFGRSASTLTLEEAAALAGTLPHPLTSNPLRAPAQMRWRQNLILDRIRDRSGEP